MLTRLFLMPLLLACSSSAMAAWVKVGGNDTVTVYADLMSIELNHDSAQMWNLIDLKAHDNSSSPSYLSMKSLAEYNCKDVTYRFLESQNFSLNMGAGEVVLKNASGEWSPIPSRSAVKMLWNIACGNVPF
jgi:hypothetical protein